MAMITSQKVIHNMILSFRATWSTITPLPQCQYSSKPLLHKVIGWRTTVRAHCVGNNLGTATSDLDLDQDQSIVRSTRSRSISRSSPRSRLNTSPLWPRLGGGVLGRPNTGVSCCVVPARHYGRKMRMKPPKVTHFEYSGDLRSLPLLDRSTVLYTYRGIEDQLEGNEVVKRLSSLEFASSHEFANHRKELIRDRIMEFFGPDSELEQQIALLTLEIRQMIPYCIQYRTDKVNKIWLLKRIFRRRRLLTKLRELDHERFEWLLRELKIRYIIPRDRAENKGWKHNLKVAAQTEAVAEQRKRLEELKEKFEEEKQTFYKNRAKVLAEIQKDLHKFGLGHNFLDQLQQVEKEMPKCHQEITGINGDN